MSPAKPVPDGYHTVTPHLAIRGAARALEFYAKAFGAEEIARRGARNRAREAIVEGRTACAGGGDRIGRRACRQLLDRPAPGRADVERRAGFAASGADRPGSDGRAGSAGCLRHEGYGCGRCGAGGAQGGVQAASPCLGAVGESPSSGKPARSDRGARACDVLSRPIARRRPTARAARGARRPIARRERFAARDHGARLA